MEAVFFSLILATFCSEDKEVMGEWGVEGDWSDKVTGQKRPGEVCSGYEDRDDWDHMSGAVPSYIQNANTTTLTGSNYSHTPYSGRHDIGHTRLGTCISVSV